MAKRKKQEPDKDLELWAQLGGGTLAPERPLTEGEKIMQAGNEWVAEQLRPSTPMRFSAPSFNPFRRDR
jgi:hypothetical protein